MPAIAVVLLVVVVVMLVIAVDLAYGSGCGEVVVWCPLTFGSLPLP